ncbi:DUF4011 domain-containing protein [Clostridium ihumii]|uniref:DUF4011 domain-containing protein n=1 Tax=Clostridium ihumii TaxID=1470356 RepID=UPI00058FAAE1|nr:DUF4011 domain-containing protein [Clostridium ihumii]
MSLLDVKVENWKKRLLDLGKRNKMINYKENGRSSIQVTNLELDELYSELVENEKVLNFDFPLISEIFSNDSEEENEKHSIVEGDLKVNLAIKEQQRLLGNLRNKSKLAKEEQGINSLYLSLGFLEWTESPNSKQILLSPIILVPVKLMLESLTDPYTISATDDDIVVNPTLAFKMEHDYGITLPDFNHEEDSIESYLKLLEKIIKVNNWTVKRQSSISLLSFLKINMYNDLEKNIEKIRLNPIVSAIAGEKNELMEPPASLNNYNHDKNKRPSEVFQILDADSSQQDAALYAKEGVSFVLQGPPGTGKSQTITNIISEALADGKKVLFVAEKMAALEVVYNRLSSAKLGDFCLTLHSHKANKKHIIKELYEMLTINKVKLREEALYDLDTLEHERNKLNEYCDELHKICEPLHKSVYEVNGALSKLLDVENIIFNIDNIKDVDEKHFNEYKYYLEEFAKTVGKNNNDYLLNPWRNCNINIVTNELRHDIEKYLGDLLPNVQKLSVLYKQLLNKYSIEFENKYSEVKKLEEFLLVCSESLIVPENWLIDEDVDELSNEANRFNNVKSEYNELISFITSRYGEEYLIINAEKVLNDFITVFNNFKELINQEKFDNDDDLIINSISNLRLIVLDVIDSTREICSVAKNISNIFNIKETDMNMAFINNNLKLIELIILNPKPTVKWFELEEFQVAKRICQEFKDNYEKYKIETDELFKEFDKSILDIDYENIIVRFKTEYTSFLKIFNKNYKVDKNLFKSHSIEVVKKIENAKCIEVLNKIKSIQELKKYFEDNKEKFELYLGKHYKAEYTDFDEINKSMNNFESIISELNNKLIPKKIKYMLISGNLEELINIYNVLNENILSNENIKLFKENFKTNADMLEFNFNDCLKFLKDILNNIDSANQCYNSFIKYAKQKFQYKVYLQDLNKLIRIQNICNDIKEKEDLLEKKYRFLYQGIESNWDDIIRKLEWVGKFKVISKNYNINYEFKCSICSDKTFIDALKADYNRLIEYDNNTKSNLNWFISIFFKDEFLSVNIDELQIRIEECLHSISSLELWIDYRTAREKCIEIGLSDYINKIESEKISSSMIIPIFLKRFYRLWLDNIMNEMPAINQFRRRSQEDRIKEFKKLDTSQFKIAQNRIKERLINSLPDINYMTSAKDEVGVLKREASKQRNIMSLRKLFNNIPELILTLKPCLMMSPLSVSMFLESEKYNFDLVIFDEASQVCTEDAIGAIHRGKQIIIAGDKEQLPPTNFFNASLSDSDFDNDEEENDDSDSYESVLDEALSVLPERTLLWHYRSRHEHLIAFSNIKIYGGNLITFPSNIDKVKDNGVEYIHVPDGVYEKSGKRYNLKEANKVAEMVLEHFRKLPNRSLGVVTFSQSQQYAIELAIIELRKKNPQYEDFFNEDKEEPFFIKNLENVQGDERDTIIFSIGYARDFNGKMYMNFGPLSRTGGYRRLNVAITRAKYNVKLVGSILPTDIDLSRTKAEGVKMLRSYMEFAMQGMNAVVNEIKESEIVCLESPFEESVYDYLVSKGYNVATQVGCSGYRIDMAIKHPTLSGTYVLGIECDGATYHSARTSRERDRLRQSVLENIGWTIYRIWSTDWIKDKNTEGNNLIKAIEKAIAQYGNKIEEKYTGALESNKDNSNEILSGEDYLIEEKKVIDKYNPYGFKIYKEANTSRIIPNGDFKLYISELIKCIIQEEYPINFELLCKRLAPVLGNQKVTSKIRNEVSYIISNYCGKFVNVINGYCWYNNATKAVVRIPEENAYEVRQIQYISMEELQEAMITIVQKSFGLTKDDLISITAKVFGFNRVGPKIVKAINEAFDKLIDAKKFILEQNKVNIIR